MHKDIVTALKTQTDPASTKDASVTTKPTAAVSKQQPAASTSSSTAVTTLTIGEMAEKYLDPKRIACLKWKTCFSPRFFRPGKKQLLITKLPRYYDGCYTEDDIAKLLMPFGFQHEDESLYVVPQACMAFVRVPTPEAVHEILRFSKKRTGFKRSILGFYVVENGITMKPFGFYKSLMRVMQSPVIDDGSRTIFIKNISQTETRNLREAVKKIGFVRNFLPLLNKLFIEFESVRDADRLGVWYSLLKQDSGHVVQRLNTPSSSSVSLPPKLPENALPDSKDAVAEATVPPVQFGVPHGSIAPFWVTMRTRPFLFPTMSPWFIIPDHLTVRGKDDIEKARGRGSVFPTIMMTGFPRRNYTQEEVAKLVWRYFPKQNLHALYYNVVVLMLQRRAFVYFADWPTCCDFVRDHIINPVSVKGCTLSVHFVLQDMNPESSEEMMYKNLMKWSNAGVPEPKSLEERLLCVEISETSVDIVRMVMEVVSSIASFVGFLPLANRICIEMADSSGVTKVVEKYKTFSPESLQKRELWSRVQRFETLKSLKQRLDDASEITINFEDDTINVVPEPPAVKCQTQPPFTEPSDNGSQPALQASGLGGSANSEPITEGANVTATNVVEMEEDGEKPATEIAMDSTIGPDANEAVEKVEVKEDEGSLITSIAPADVTSAGDSGNTATAASSSTASATAFLPEEKFAELPEINTDIVQALTAAVHQHKLAQSSRSQSQENESLSKNNTSSETATAEETPQRMDTQDDFTADTFSSDAYLFDEQNFNMEDFVTVDEVGDDVEDTTPEPCSTSSSSSRARRERQSSSVLAGDKQASTRSSRDSRSSSSLSKSTKGSSTSKSTSVSPKRSKDSSEPTKSPTKPLSSSNVRKPSSSSPFSTETSSSPGQKVQQSKTKSPSKASNNVYSVRSTRSSSAACEREKIRSETSVAASVDTHMEPLRKEAKATGGTVAKSDHKLSAEGTAAKTVESETKIDQPPPDCHNEHTLKDPDCDVTEQEAFEILDSIEDQTATEDETETSSDQLDQPTTTESESDKQKRTKQREGTARKDDRSKRSGSTTTASRSEEEKSPKKQDRTVKMFETPTKRDTKKATEEMVFEIVDSVNDEPVQEAATTET
ncbi:uncharacterized protein LOC118338205, partial [Morone saxatilis]|uniref:uncharacterized protein LOC118338205 n=1 Tax=Morone saxatilis TaxID=34816 RepID=UPI0015E1DBC4